MSKVDTPETVVAVSLQEKISSMVDGELNHEECAEVVAEITAGNESSSWDQYHLIGEAMRHNLPDTICPDLSINISAAIASEPVHQSNSIPLATNTDQAVTNVVPAVTQVKSPVFGYAIAASISMIAIVGLFQLNQGESLSPVVTQLVVSHQPQAVSAPLINGISWSQQTSQETVLVRRHQSLPTVPSERVHRYLINHNQHSVAMPAQGAMLPYVRMVGYERAQ